MVQEKNREEGNQDLKKLAILKVIWKRIGVSRDVELDSEEVKKELLIQILMED
jgi:hypothetical protein